jgi:hypothetical protein
VRSDGDTGAVTAEAIDDLQESFGRIDRGARGVGPLALHDPDAQTTAQGKRGVVGAARPTGGYRDAELYRSWRAFEKSPRHVDRLGRERVEVKRPSCPRRSGGELGEEHGIEVECRQLDRDVTVELLARKPLERREVYIGDGPRALLCRRGIADRRCETVRREPTPRLERVLEARTGGVCGRPAPTHGLEQRRRAAHASSSA